MISSVDLGFLGLHSRTKTSSGDWPKVAFNSMRPLLLNFEKIKKKHFSHIIVAFKLHKLLFNTTIT